MPDTFSNADDFVDSRDVIQRIDELETMRDDEEQAEGDFTEDDAEELRILAALAEEAEGYIPDWNYGEQLIRESYFTDYARELADDIGAIDRNADWPLSHIDWDAAAEQLKMDYVEVDFDGVTYLAR